MSELAIFQGKKIRRHWDTKQEKWYFSVVDIIAVLTDQSNFQVARKYWNKLSERLKKEGSEVVTNCHRLKMEAEDGKLRETDAADVETILRLVQSVPSPKAEPIMSFPRKWESRNDSYGSPIRSGMTKYETRAKLGMTVVYA